MPTPADGRQEQAQWPRFTTWAREAGFVHTHAVPLRLRQRVVGALNLFQHRPGSFTQADRLLAQALADIATITILQQRTLDRATSNASSSRPP
ncbi:GAF domain-containing protein [Streptomyces sp. NBC_01262]|uniref:GAF domain-containing protein n=1 Tax=Streptomyces sp. NBC_01262 TaxID=2903803 RepID=UPI002E30B6E3|nr:GAF domain-containing protein [Streptomyces sp. NBC_01262]